METLKKAAIPPTGGNSGQGELQAQAGEQENAGQGELAGSDSQGTSSEATSDSTAGTSQNAMEFLQGLGDQDGDAGEGNSDASGADNGQGQDSSDAQAQTGQQSEGKEREITSKSPTIPPPVSAEESEAQSIEGISQNALEYLTGDDAQSGDTTSVESVTTESTTDPEATLSIKELLNAKGVDNTTETNLPQATDDPERNSSEDSEPGEKQ